MALLVKSAVFSNDLTAAGNKFQSLPDLAAIDLRARLLVVLGTSSKERSISVLTSALLCV